MTPVTAAISSAKTVENHMPSTPSSSGSRSTAPSSNTNVRKKDISADICPLFNAVKKAEAKIAIPVNRYAKETILNACTASASSVSSCRNKAENGFASNSDAANIAAEVSPMITRLFFQQICELSVILRAVMIAEHRPCPVGKPHKYGG